jgi:putative ABC transport system ATP-binding protein
LEPFIVCENLVKIYKVSGLEVVALQGLDLTVQRGELMGIVGASGSGKSTLLNILGGLDRPSAGRVTVNGRDLLKASDPVLDEYRHSEVGFVWQQPARNLIPYLSAQANVELPLSFTGMGLREKRDWVQELLNAVGLWEHRRHRLAQLSGGEQQRVAIAVALASKPQLLLGDEPTGEVDSGTARGILDLFRHMNEQYGLTTIIVTHDPQVASVVDRVMTIRDGRTSSEAVRRVADTSLRSVQAVEAVLAQGLQDTHFYEEYVVVDAAGRLQIPAELRERTGIGSRVTLEEGEDGIVIRPVAGLQPIVSPNGQTAATMDEQHAVDAKPTRARRKGWRWLGRKKEV